MEKYNYTLHELYLIITILEICNSDRNHLYKLTQIQSKLSCRLTYKSIQII